MAGYEYEIRVGAADTSSADYITTLANYSSLDMTKNYTAMSDWTATVPYDSALSDYLTRRVFIVKIERDSSGTITNEDTLFAGYLETHKAQNETTTTVGGRDILKELTEDSDTVTYSNIYAEAALKDFWNTHTPFNYTVERPALLTEAGREADTTTELQNIYKQPSSSEMYSQPHVSSKSAYPLTFANGMVDMYETGGNALVAPADDYTGTYESSGGYNGSGSYSLDYGQYVTKGKEYAGIQSTPSDYDTAPSDVEAYVYFDGAGTISESSVSIYVNGSLVTSDAFPSSGSYSDGWYSIFDNGSTAESNVYANNWSASASNFIADADESITIRVENNNDSSSWAFHVRGMYAGDTNFHPDAGEWTNSANRPGYYPDTVEMHLDDVSMSEDIGYVEMAGVVDTATEYGGSIETIVSTDGASTWNVLGSGGYQNFENEHELSPPSNTSAKYALLLNVARPGNGDIPDRPALKSISERTATRDFTQIDNKTFEGSYMNIAQELHELVGYRFSVGDYDTNAVVSFDKQSVEPEPEYTVTDYSRNRDVRNYFNRLVATSSGLTNETVENPAEQTIFGKTIEVRRDFPDAGSQSELRNKAKSALTDGVQKRGNAGSVEAVPALIEPGRRYPIGVFNRVFKDNDNAGLNALRFTDADNEYVEYNMSAVGSGYAYELLVRPRRFDVRSDTAREYLLSSANTAEMLVIYGDGSVEANFPGDTATLTAPAGTLNGDAANRISISVAGDDKYLYIDGTQVDMVTTTSNAHDYGTVWFGCPYNNGTSAEAFVGGLDDFRYITRHILEEDASAYPFTEVPDDEMVSATTTTRYDSIRDYYKFNDTKTPDMALNSAPYYAQTATVNTEYDNVLGTLDEVSYTLGNDGNMSFKFNLAGRVDVELRNMLREIDSLKKAL